MIVRTASAEATRAVGAAIASCLAPGDVVLLGGDLGTGKTTLAQGIAAGLGVTEPVVSPTFAIVREYAGRVPVAHVDVYRLDYVQELHDLGFEEIVDGTRVVLVEWGELVAPIFSGERIVVRLSYGNDDDDTRAIDLTAEGSARSASLSARLADALEAF
ncbi:MAG: tRNA threonylcarbamoyladenosine biosynthesis protein TsaE [Actinomycetota bacterium]|nr:tRNA threonylcarbamoyladenosine biosynthesis protein TsaE [Actinomycetota bacterium]